MIIIIFFAAIAAVLSALLLVNLSVIKELRRMSEVEAEFAKEFEDILQKKLSEKLDENAALMERLMREELAEKLRPLISDGFKPIEMLSEMQRQNGERQSQQVQQLEQSVRGGLSLIQQRTAEDSIKQERASQQLRESLRTEMESIRRETEKQLTQMRVIVDEKLQKTLNDRLSQSFELVTKQLEQVSRGLGEMQSIAGGVGDLKRVLSDVKTRGTLGEFQLAAILEQILAPEQYVTQKSIKGGDAVDFAVKLPGAGEGEEVLLPIDSKFPTASYLALMEAYENADKDAAAKARRVLHDDLKRAARSIRAKYVRPPLTTDFAVMFLPTEGLYAEAVKDGFVEILMKERVNLAGPTTMAALLSSLQMGFKTLAVQKHAGDIHRILQNVKKEFDNFGDVLEAVRRKLKTADEDLDKMLGVRTRQIQRALRNIDDTQLTLAATETAET